MATLTQSPIDFSYEPFGRIHHLQGARHIRQESLPTAPPRTRKRAMSQVSIASTRSTASKITLDAPKTPSTSVLTVQPALPSDAFGSFTPTPSACSSLRMFAAANNTSHSRGLSIFGSRKQWSAPEPIWSTFEDSNSSPSASPRRSSSPMSINSASSRSQTIPSISRTASSFYASDGTLSDTVVSSEPSLYEYETEPKPVKVRSPAERSPKMNPILASLERKSKFCNRTLCSTCQTPGLDYPKCPRCGEMWCSRECRLKGGRKHICSIKTC